MLNSVAKRLKGLAGEDINKVIVARLLYSSVFIKASHCQELFPDTQIQQPKL
jgi:hypothetical protein